MGWGGAGADSTLQHSLPGLWMEALPPPSSLVRASSADPQKIQQIDICKFKQEVKAAGDSLFVPASE